MFRKKPAKPTVVRHEFVIGPAGPHDPFDGKGQRYTCIRCKWAFVVKGRKVVVLDDNGTPIAGSQALARLDTFADGPCGGVAARSIRLPQLQVMTKSKSE